MRKTISFLYIVATLIMSASCTDSIGLGQIDKEGARLVVYAFPTEGDTVDITISQVYPLNTKWDALQIESVKCSTNNSLDRIINRGDTIFNGFTIARYAAIGCHRSGDRISITVSAKNLPEVSGCTIIPECPTIVDARLDTMSFRGTPYPLVRLAMRDNASTPFYAVQVEGVFSDEYKNEAWNYIGSQSSASVSLKVDAEPLFANNSSADIDLGIGDSNFYNQIYTFSNSSFVDGTATLHLYVDTGLPYMFREYRPHLLALSQEYNAMLRSLNGISNNDFGKYGFAFAYSTYTNVHGGYGCIGAYAKSTACVAQ